MPKLYLAKELKVQKAKENATGYGTHNELINYCSH